MAAKEYHLVSRWRLQASAEEVYDLLAEAEDLSRWWPAAFADSMAIEPGDANGVGKVARLASRGWLPLALHWHRRIEDAEPPHGFKTRAWGDLEGAATWTFIQDGAWVDVIVDWRVRLQKPPFRYVAAAAQPLFESNYDWAMTKGEESLRLELARRHALDATERATIPPPPEPPRYPTKPALIGAALALVLFWRGRTSGR